MGKNMSTTYYNIINKNFKSLIFVSFLLFILYFPDDFSGLQNEIGIDT